MAISKIVENPCQLSSMFRSFQAIYSKIKDLNFHDCHTKIRQVDSHSTVGGGVVVQVTVSFAFFPYRDSAT